MNPFVPPFRSRSAAGFTLVEIIAVITIIVILVSISISLIGNTGAAALRTAGENLTASVEQGRTSAITRRKKVALVFLEPGDGEFDDDYCRLGLLELEDQEQDAVLRGRLLQRWSKMPGGIVFFGGEVDSLENLMDSPPVRVEWKDGEISAEARVLVFTARGGLTRPQGSESVVVTLGRGLYRNGNAVKVGKGASRTIRIGRVVARPWILDA